MGKATNLRGIDKGTDVLAFGNAEGWRVPFCICIYLLKRHCSAVGDRAVRGIVRGIENERHSKDV